MEMFYVQTVTCSLWYVHSHSASEPQYCIDSGTEFVAFKFSQLKIIEWNTFVVQRPKCRGILPKSGLGGIPPHPPTLATSLTHLGGGGSIMWRWVGWGSLWRGIPLPHRWFLLRYNVGESFSKAPHRVWKSRIVGQPRAANALEMV